MTGEAGIYTETIPPPYRMRLILSVCLIAAAAACTPGSQVGSPAPATRSAASTACAGNRILIVNNGGDEAVKNEWKASPRIQQRIR